MLIVEWLIFLMITLNGSDKYDSDFNFVGKWEGTESREIFIDSVYVGTVQFDVKLKMYADGTGIYQFDDGERSNIYWKYDEELQEMLLFIEKPSEVERGASYPFDTLKFDVILNGDEIQQWARKQYFYIEATQEWRDEQIEWNLTNN